jgi:hypothetical protein
MRMDNPPRPPASLVSEILLSDQPWLWRGLKAVKWLAQGKEPWSIEELNYILIQAAARPPKPSSTGALLRYAQRTGVIVKYGSVRAAASPAAKYRRIPLWIGARRDSL